MLPQNKPDRIRILFDDHRLVANAGLILPATLALRLGLPQLLRKHVDLGGAPGRANTGDKMMTLVASALAGGDWIDDADVLRAGGTAGVLGFTAKAADAEEDAHYGPARRGDELPEGLEVWPESHWPGFALRQADVFLVLYGMVVYAIRFNNQLLHRQSTLGKRRLGENRGFRPSF